MAKVKTRFFCQNCGTQSGKWIGQCPSCNEWNTYVEEVVEKKSASANFSSNTNGRARQPQAINTIEAGKQSRIQLADNELNNVLGKGLVAGSITLFGGEPGIGKSTLMLQIALKSKLNVLYISGEESEQQIKLRADRIGIENNSCLILTETSLENVFQQLKKHPPQLLIIDSIQTLHTSSIESAPGSVSQIRECAGQLLRYAKETNTPVFLIGHINKEGSIAGPKILEHMVDTVLQFEGDRHHIYRLLRSTKNRFGSTNELGIYQMDSSGLREVANPSEILISNNSEQLSGVTVAATMEGMRPLLIETQALVSSAAYGTPQRSATGFDLRRLNMLLAVLEKRCGFKLGAKDVFINIAGGIRVDEPAIDLSIVCAVLSSSEDIPISPKTCFAAEVGLSGEIRAVNRIEQRISEAEKLGFEKIFVAENNMQSVSSKNKIEVVPLARMGKVFQELFG